MQCILAGEQTDDGSDWLRSKNWLISRLEHILAKSLWRQKRATGYDAEEHANITMYTYEQCLRSVALALVNWYCEKNIKDTGKAGI